MCEDESEIFIASDIFTTRKRETREGRELPAERATVFKEAEKKDNKSPTRTKAKIEDEQNEPGTERRGRPRGKDEATGRERSSSRSPRREELEEIADDKANKDKKTDMQGCDEPPKLKKRKD